MSKAKKKAWSIFKIVLFAILGFIIGYFIINVEKNGYSQAESSSVALTTTFLTGACVVGIELFILKKLKQAEKFKYKIEENDHSADKYDYLYNKIIYIVSLLVYAAMFLSLVNIVVIAILQPSSSIIWIITLIPFLLCLHLSNLYSKRITKIDERLPKHNDPEYMEKLIKSLDEGEKHMTYEALFKLYRYNLSILILLIVILAAYASITSANLTAVLLLLLGFFIFNIVFYYAKIGKYYKQ